MVVLFELRSEFCLFGWQMKPFLALRRHFADSRRIRGAQSHSQKLGIGDKDSETWSSYDGEIAEWLLSHPRIDWIGGEASLAACREVRLNKGAVTSSSTYRLVTEKVVCSVWRIQGV